MAEIVVADAGPLIASGRLRKLDLLGRIFEKVIVPRVVFEETQFRPDLADARFSRRGNPAFSPWMLRLPAWRDCRPMSSLGKGKRQRYRLPRSAARKAAKLGLKPRLRWPAGDPPLEPQVLRCR